jgi:hypothetical protein
VASRCERAEVVRCSDDVGKVVRPRFRARRHDRVLVITEDQQLDRPLSWSVPWHVPLHVWDLSDQDTRWASVTRHRYRYHGRNDNAVRVIPLFEAGEQGLWPW